MLSTRDIVGVCWIAAVAGMVVLVSGVPVPHLQIRHSLLARVGDYALSRVKDGNGHFLGGGG